MLRIEFGVSVDDPNGSQSSRRGWTLLLGMLRMGFGVSVDDPGGSLPVQDNLR